MIRFEGTTEIQPSEWFSSESEGSEEANPLVNDDFEIIPLDFPIDYIEIPKN